MKVKSNNIECETCRDDIEAIAALVRDKVDTEYVEGEIAGYNHRTTGSWDITTQEFAEGVECYIDNEIDELGSLKDALYNKVLELAGEVSNEN